MPRYIDADDFKNTLIRARNEGIEKFSINALARYMDTICVSDVAKVVRCKDCRGYDAKHLYCVVLECKMNNNDFCSYGQRREQDETN